MIELKPLVQKHTIPKIFQEIIENDAARGDILLRGVDMSKEDWRELKQLHARKKNLRRAAETALSHNENKGA